MKNYSIVLIFLLASSISFAQAQSGINTKTPTTTLEVVANGADNTVLDGITIPKLTCVEIINKQLNAVTPYGLPQAGTIVYITDTDGLCSNDPPVTEVGDKGVGFYVFDGIEFIKVALDSGFDNTKWDLSGNTATDPTTDFIGTTDSQDLAIRTNNTERVRVTTAGNIGIGTTTPTTTLQIVGQPTDGTIADGVTIPNLTGANLTSKNINTTYTVTEIGTVVYITEPAPNPLAAELTENVTSAGLFYFDGTTWQRVSNSRNSWSIEGNIGTDATTDFIGTTDAQDLVFKTNSEDIGNTGIDEEALRLTVDNEAIVTGKSLGTNITNEDFPVSGVNDPVDLLRMQSTVFDGAGDIENNVLRTYFRRQVGGINWTRTNLRTQKLVDIAGTYTKQGFIDYGIDGVESSAGLGFGSGTTTHMVIQEDGNVGIGALPGDVNLYVRDTEPLGESIGDFTPLVTFESNLNSNLGYLNMVQRRHLALPGWTGANTRIQQIVDIIPHGFIDFGINELQANRGLGFGSGTTTHMVVEDNGNVGIGTTAPVSKLQLSNSVNLGTSFSSFDDYQLLLWENNALPRNSYGIGIESGTMAFNSNDQYDFKVNGIDRMTIANDKVGIGTTTPAESLDVNGAIQGNNWLKLFGGAPTILLRDTNNRSGFIHMNSDLMYFLNGGVNGSTWTNRRIGNYWPLTINMSNDVSTFGGQVHFMEGNVGIGTSSPSFPLDVNGNIRGSEVVSSGGTFRSGSRPGNNYALALQGDRNMVLYDNGPIWSSGTQVSDIRTKKNIKLMEDSALSSLANIDIIRFDYKDELEMPGRQLGVIAQQILVDYPSYVKMFDEGTENERYLVNYDKLSVIALKAIKELKEKMDAQQKVIDTLSLRLKALEDK